MRFAIISDIHNNLEAFRTTLADIDQQNVDKICCLGDLLGYGPKPIECVDLMMDLRRKGRVETCLAGNHDQAAMFDPEGFNSIAEAAVMWTREQLETARGMRAADRLDFLGEIQNQRSYRRGDLYFVHGSPRNTLNEYVFPEDIDDKDKMAKIFSLVPKFCFMGHTHVPGIFLDQTTGENYSYFSYEDIEKDHGGRFTLGDQKLLVNVGSVGQPRDLDPRSCYVVLNYDDTGADNYIEFRRVKYNIEKTVDDFSKINALASYPFLWQRIREGR